MNHHDEVFHPETVDEYIEWLVNREKQARPLPQDPGAPNLPSGTSAHLVHDLRHLAQHDARRLARIRERLASHVTAAPILTPPAPLQNTQETDLPPPTQREKPARDVRGIRPPFQESAFAPDPDTQEMPILEPATLRSRVPGQKRRTGAGQLSRWTQTLAAVLILGVLIGSLVTALALRQLEQQGRQTTPTPLPVCQAYPLKQFAVPQHNTTGDALLAVTAVSANDAWTVGTSPRLDIGDTTLIEHWDGTGWQIVTSPNGPNGSGRLDAVAAASADDVWAVGYYEQQVNPPQGKTSFERRALIEHWDGQQWNVVPNSNSVLQNVSDSHLNAVAVVSANDVWAVGQVFSSHSQSGQMLIEHWDGKTWHVISGVGSTAADATSEVTNMQAISANDIWAVGYAQLGSNQQGGLLLHWDGAHWTVVPAPLHIADFFKVSAVSGNDVWAIGMDATSHELFAHWDGHQWSEVPDPQLPTTSQGGMPQISLTNIAAVASNDVWAVGSLSTVSAQSEVLILHWDGKVWQQVATPALAVSGQQHSFGIAVYRQHQMWIVGVVGNESLIVGQRSCP